MRELPDLIRHRLSSMEAAVRTEWEARPAAVLMPLFKKHDDWHLLFTRRTDNVESHRGQVAFPGGLIEARDLDPIEAALRETQEEIGISRADVEILGTLDPLFTVTQFLITPVVGTIPWPYPMQINHDEVVRVFGVPLHWLADESNRETRQRELPTPGGKVPVIYFRPFEGEVIWGATARITLNFLSIIEAKD